MGGGLESRCVGRVYGADGAVHHPSLRRADHSPRGVLPSAVCLSMIVKSQP